MVEHWGFRPSLRCLHCYGKDAGGVVKKLSYDCCFFEVVVYLFVICCITFRALNGKRSLEEQDTLWSHRTQNQYINLRPLHLLTYSSIAVNIPEVPHEYSNCDSRTGNDLMNTQVIVPVPIEGVVIQRALTVFGFDDAPHGHAEVGICIFRFHIYTHYLSYNI